MPLTRYQLRNEYSLADPELYRAADKDDPEALLEGVAMAGLVGVLRQLGDLAEFAAEIFHDLHEEVMATSARGHGLTLRVQQLEAEFPSIERAFLSQTSHSLFLHNAGVDWHPNLRMDQNLITQGDLPRSVMDSYEECRGPPRLFLLDKFDTAGAGACLKRYTDPSFFKAEFTSSEAKKEDLKRDKRARKVKKKGARWRTTETPELTPSNTKLHQLFLEERCQSENNVHTYRVKLKKRQSNNALVDSTTGKSYMERFLYSLSPDRKFVCERSASPSRLEMGSSNSSELIPEMHVIHARSPANKLLPRDRSPVPSHGIEEKVLEPLLDEFSRDAVEERNLRKLLDSTPDVELESIPSTFYKEDRKESTVNAEGKAEAGPDGYRSDDANSEMDNYTDALTTMDSEIDTDTESKPKNERGFKIETKYVDFETNKEQELQAQFSDSQSKGSSIASDDGNGSFRKGRFSSSYSDTLNNSAEKVPSDSDLAVKVYPYTLAENVDISSKNISENGKVSGTRSLEYAVHNGTNNEVSEIPSYSSKFREASYSSDVTDLASVLSNLSPGASLNEVQLFQPHSVNISSGVMNSVTGELSAKSGEDGGAGHDLSCMTNVSDTPSQSKGEFLSMGSGKSQPEELLDVGNLESPYVALMHLSNILGPAHEERDVMEEMLPIDDAHSSHIENLRNGKLDSPDPVTLGTDKQLYGLDVQDPQAWSGTRSAPEGMPDFCTNGDMDDGRPSVTVLDTEDVIPSGEISEYLTSMVDCLETGDFREQKYLKMTNQAPLLESDMAKVGITGSEVETLCNNLESNISAGSDMETSCNNLKSNMLSDSEVKDELAPDRIHLNSSNTERSTATSHDFPFECTISDTTKPVSDAEAHIQVDDSETANIHSEAGVEDNVVNCRPTGSPSEDHIKLLEDCLSSKGDLKHDKLEISAASDPINVISSDPQKEAENQQIVAPLDDNIELCNMERDYPSSPEFLDDSYDALPVETQNNLYHSEGTEAPSPTKESDQTLELSQPLQVRLSADVKETTSSASYLLEPGALLEGGQELHAEEDNVPSLQEVGESSKSSYYQYDLTESPNQIFCDASSIGPAKTSSSEPLSQPSDLNFLPLTTSYEFERSEQSVIPLQPICQDFGLHPDASNQQLLDPLPQRAVLDILLPDNNALQASVVDKPPLPPLPPMQWRIGKPQHDSPTSEGEMVQSSFSVSSPLSPETADEKPQLGFPTFYGELAQTQNPFLPYPISYDEMPQHGFQISRTEVVQPSLSPSSSVVPAVEYEKIQEDHPTLEPTTAQPPNPFLPLTDEEPEYCSSNLEGEVLHLASLNRFATTLTTEDLNARHVSLTTQEEPEQSLDSLAPMKRREDGKPYDTFVDSVREMVQQLNSITPPTIENEKHGYVSQTMNGELNWQSNTSAVVPTVEDTKPNGSLKTRLARPRDPLIEAVASHNKSDLRKVTERIRPEIGPQVDERNSLLEQIRTKSFNLKPAVGTRPSIQGPKTNLKVVAILEKANAIRQALAGSDDDDEEDSWSDS